MSNLGLYETIVRAAHDVGGVEELVAMIARKGFEKGMKAGVASQRPVIAGVGLASLAVGGIIGYLLSDPFTLKADDIMAGDEDMEHINREFVKIINSEDDIEHVRPAMEKLDLDEPGDPSLDELKTRLAAFEGVVSCDSEFEEPVATRIDFEDELFAFMSEIDLCEEDEPLIKIATNHPLYKSFAKTYRKHEPEASELQTVRAFVRTMAPEKELEGHDEVQS